MCRNMLVHIVLCIHSMLPSVSNARCIHHPYVLLMQSTCEMKTDSNMKVFISLCCLFFLQNTFFSYYILSGHEDLFDEYHDEYRYGDMSSDEDDILKDYSDYRKRPAKNLDYLSGGRDPLDDLMWLAERSCSRHEPTNHKSCFILHIGFLSEWTFMCQFASF